MLRVSKVRLDYERLPEGDSKKVLLRTIERAENVLRRSCAADQGGQSAAPQVLLPLL